MEKNCIFCQIVRREKPCYKVYEDSEFLGFLDINPVNPGHSLVVPKKHYRWVYDVPNFGQYFQAAKKVALAQIKALKAESVSFATLGHEVEHAHIWVIPRFKNDGHGGVISWGKKVKLPKEKMEKIAKEIYRKV